MAPPRLVVMDVDGTLAYRGSVTETMGGHSTAGIDALDAVRERASLALVSGRSEPNLRSIGDALAIPHLVAELGGLLLDDGRPPRPTVPWPHAETPAARARRSGLVAKVLSLHPTLADVSPRRRITVPLKGPVRPGEPAEVRRLVESIHPGYTALDNGEHTHDTILHVAPVGVGKVAGVRALQERLGVGPAETILIGDSPQDASCHAVCRTVHIVSNGHTNGVAAPNIRRTRRDHGLGVAEALAAEFGPRTRV